MHRIERHEVFLVHLIHPLTLFCVVDSNPTSVYDVQTLAPKVAPLKLILAASKAVDESQSKAYSNQ